MTNLMRGWGGRGGGGGGGERETQMNQPNRHGLNCPAMQTLIISDQRKQQTDASIQVSCQRKQNQSL